MAEPPRILIAGGYGVFGRLLAREILDRTAAQVIVAGRDGQRADAVCQALGSPGRVLPWTLDLGELSALRRAARGCFAVVCAAGPFQRLPPGLAEAAVESGAHWLDIGDAPAWVLPLLADRRLHDLASAANRVVLPGLSSVPALTGVLARWCHQRLPGALGGQLTLFIGNRNRKGTAAIASALGAGLADPRPVRLPVGRRTAYRFASPDQALLREELGLVVDFRVAFEWSGSSRLMAALAPLARRLDGRSCARLARCLSILAAPMSQLGSTTGCVQAELWDRSSIVSAAFTAAGQRLAVLPCVLALERLIAGTLERRGVVHPATWLTPDEWVCALEDRGVRFSAGNRRGNGLDMRYTGRANPGVD